MVQPVTSQDEPANETAQQIPGTVANPDDADQVWTALLDSVAGKNAWTWLRSVNLNRIEKNVAHVSIEPGHSDIRKFAEHRIESLSKLIRPIVGRPVQVKIEDEMAINEAPGKDDDDNPMDLPLVQQVMDVFRDAKIISSRKEETESNDV